MLPPWTAQSGGKAHGHPRGLAGEQVGRLGTSLLLFRNIPGKRVSRPLSTYGYPPEGLELQVGEMLRKLLGFQVIKEQGDFPLLAGVRFYPLREFPGPVTAVAFVMKCEREDGERLMNQNCFLKPLSPLS